MSEIEMENEITIIENDKKHKEVEKFVIEWLHELVDNITEHKTKENIQKTTRKRKLEEILEKFPNSTTKTIEATEPGLEIISIDESRNFYQLKALFQHDRTSCGYFALYFAKNILQSLLSSKNSIEKLGNRVGFYCEKIRWQKILKEKATVEGNEYFPWNFSSICSDVMERDYLHYLLHNDSELLHLGGPQQISAVSEMYRECLQKGFLSADKIVQLQEIFERFQHEDHFSHAFIIGSYSHWVLIVLHKYIDDDDHHHDQNHKRSTRSDRSARTKIEGIFIDSFNLSILSTPHDQLTERVINTLRKRKIPEEEIETRLGKQMKMIDSILFSISLTFDCARGVRNFIEENIFLQTDFLLNDFFRFLSLNNNNNNLNNGNNNNNNNENENEINQQTKKRKTEEDEKSILDFDFNEDNLQRIEEWFQNDYHPAILFDIFENLLDLKSQVKTHNLRASKLDRLQRLDQWQKRLCSLAKKESAKNYPLFLRFVKNIAPKIRRLLK